MDLTNEVFNSLNKYFSTLSVFGYKSYKEVEKLLIYIFIEELSYGPMSEYITNSDYNDISNALECLYGSCMIPYPTSTSEVTPINPNNVLRDKIRVKESDEIRSTESYNFRVV